MSTCVASALPLRQLQPVRSPSDIEYLIKESEVLTGLRGRVFIIAGADRIHYRIDWHPLAYRVERLDDRGNPLSTQYLSAALFYEHSVIEALMAGQLFTPMIRR